MTTIKIYDAMNDDRNIELRNVGEAEVDVMEIYIDDPDTKDIVTFALSKQDAKQLVAYLKTEFKI